MPGNQSRIRMRVKSLEGKKGKPTPGTPCRPVSLVYLAVPPCSSGAERGCACGSCGLRLCPMPSPLLLVICQPQGLSLVEVRVGELGGSAAKPENKTFLSVTWRPLFPPNSGGRGTSGFLWGLLGVSPCEHPTSCGGLWPGFQFVLTLLYVDNVTPARW